MMHPVRSKLHVRLFVWLVGTIVVTAAVSFGLFHLLMGPRAPDQYLQQLGAFTGERFAEVWDEPERLQHLGQSIHQRFDVNLSIVDANGAPRGEFGPPCRGPSLTIPVQEGARTLGSVTACTRPGPHRPPFFLALGVAALGLWVASWVLARRLTHPLSELSRVAREIGEGKLDSRARLASEQEDEVGRLARSINEMARRIERQIADQKELLAAVSHELRTPLGHLRVIVEIARKKGFSAEHIEKIDEEVKEIDDLIDRLLASSRVDFNAIHRTEVNARELIVRSLERANLRDPSRVEVEAGTRFPGDQTLLRRALANMIDNALRHGGGLSRIGCLVKHQHLEFFVEDNSTPEQTALFVEQWKGRRARQRSVSEGGLGLGLSLVEKIARAHGGELIVSVAPAERAHVAFTIPTA
jgi:signal transduction histidine kinase